MLIEREMSEFSCSCAPKKDVPATDEQLRALQPLPMLAARLVEHEVAPAPAGRSWQPGFLPLI